jgi:hypothetical protein
MLRRRSSSSGRAGGAGSGSPGRAATSSRSSGDTSSTRPLAQAGPVSRSAARYTVRRSQRSMAVTACTSPGGIHTARDGGTM